MATIRNPKIAKAPHAVSGKPQDEVLLSRCVYKNQYERRSLTVHHVQRRLNELGYSNVFADKDGYYGDHTRSAVAAFQRDREIAVDQTLIGFMDAATFEELFRGDVNVVIA